MAIEISVVGDAVPEGNNSAGNPFFRFVVTLSEPAVDAVTVNYRTLRSGTANDVDIYYSVTGADNNGVLTFAPGETSKNIFIRVQSGTGDERDESVVVELFDPKGAEFAGDSPVLRSTGIIRDDDGAGPNLSIFVSDPVIVEGDSGQKNAVFEVRLSQPAPSAFSVGYQTADGTALAGSDYVATSGTLNFAIGQEVVSVSVPVLGDVIGEAAETFSLVVTPPASPSIGTEGLVGEALILDTDTSPLPEISVVGDAVPEGNNSAGNPFFRFVVTLSEPAVDAVTVNYRTLRSGTANDVDIYYSVTGADNNGVLTFAPGETSKNIFIRVQSGTGDERDESVVVELFDPKGAEFAGDSPVLRSTGIIRDDDGAGPNLSIFVSDPVIVEGDSGQKNAVFEVRLSQPAPSAFSVGYQTADGTALAGSDYVATSGTLNFAIGQEVVSVSVPVLGDVIGEAAETFSLVVTPPASPSIGTEGLVGEALILDTDTSPLPEISVVGDAVPEGNNSAGNPFFRFVVTLSEPAVDAVTVNYRTLRSGTANDVDIYYSVTGADNNGVLTFAPGETSKNIFIRVQSGTGDERDESVVVELFDPKGAEFAGDSPVLRSTGIIRDDDGAGPNLSIFVSDPVIVEGDSGQKNAVFEVRLSQPAPSAFSVGYQTADGTALAGSDYVATSGTLNFAIGQEVVSVSVPVLGDVIGEAAETFSLVVTPPASPSIGTEGLVGEALILDTDTSPLPEISVVGDAVPEGNNSAGNPFFRFVVTLSEPATTPVTVDFETLTGSTIGTDLYYSLTGDNNNGTLTFAPAETSKSIFIRVGSDSTDERDETIFLRLTDPNGAVFARHLGELKATGFILDDDGVGLNIALASAGGTIRETGLDTTSYEIPVELSRTSATGLVFDVAVAGGMASAGSDFVLTGTTVTFAPGQTSAAIGLNVLGDQADELDETIILQFTPQAGSIFAGDIALVTVTLEDGPDIGTSGNDEIVGTPYQDALDGRAGNDTITGIESADTLIGGLGNDTLDGGTNPEGASGQGDVMLGGAGNDTYHVDSGLDLVDEDAYFPGFGSGGADTIVSTTDFYWDIASVGERVMVSEDVVDAGNDGVTIVGGIFDNTLEGHSGTDVMFGRGGTDIYRGGDGVDWYSLSLLGTDGAYPGIDGPNKVIVEQRESGPISYDIIFEFEAGKDKVDVSDYASANGLDSGADVIARAVNDGLGSSFIILGDGLDYVYMVGLEVADLQAGDFVIA